MSAQATARKRPSARKRPRKPAAPKAGRPHMPGYGVVAGSRGLLPWSWAARRLAKSRTYWLVTVRPNGAPHVMPVWGLWFENAFYFSTGPRSRKARNLAANRRCVVCADDAEQAVIVEGTARVARDKALLKRLAGPYAAKYKPWKLDPALGPVYAVQPRVVFGLWEQKFQASATRWTL